MTSSPAAAQHVRDLARLRRVRDRIDHLMTRRVERATALRRRGDLSVTEVSIAVGR